MTRRVVGNSLRRAAYDQYYVCEVKELYIKMNDDKSLIITVPSTIYRGENNSGMITFLVPAQYQGKNLTGCYFWMRYTLPSNVGDSEPLSIESEIHKGYLKLSTTINTRISKEEGPVTVWLTATDSSDYMVFKSGELRINIGPSQDISDCLEQEDVDQLDLIDIEVDKLQDAVEDLEERIGQSAEGISPTVTLNETDDGVLLAITDKDGTKTATIRHGQDGKQGPVGETGATGASGKDGQNGKDGRDGVDGAPGPAGKDGKDGKDGYTPVKGIDYFDGEDGRDGVDGKDGAPGKDGSDASVTTENIKSALGYAPADEKVVSQLSEDKVNKPTSGNGTAGQFLTSDGNGGTVWVSLPMYNGEVEDE